MPKTNLDFEASIKELENIIKLLESGEVSLEESIKLFEKGVTLTDNCRKTLENAREKIITLTQAEDEANND